MVLYPNIWGEGGALFAYSGMDGRTSARDSLVGSTLPNSRGFVFHTPSRPVLRFGVRAGDSEAAPDSIEDRVVSGGLIVSRLRYRDSVIKLEYVWADCATLLARVTALAAPSPVRVFLESDIAGAEASIDNGCLLQQKDRESFTLAGSGGLADAGEGRMYVTLSREGESAVFGWSRSSGSGTAGESASAAVKANVDALVGEQMRFFEELPAPQGLDDALLRTYYKCASVMKVNCCSPEPNIPFPWTTPDRWPHRHMWIWDSAFHAIGLRHFAPGWAEDAIKAVLSAQRDDGFVPHMITEDGSDDSDIIQPPILAWASWNVYETTRSRRFLEYVYPRVGKMLRYNFRALDKDGNGLSGWESGGASGMDNSPRFDQPWMDSIDLNCYLVNDARWLARIAREMELEPEAAAWEKEAYDRARRIDSLLWDSETEFYYDSAPDGSLVRIKTEAGLTPLFARVCSPQRAEALVRRLSDPAQFWRTLPVASVSADEPTFSDNMWRGPVWVNYNYFLIEALPHYGRAGLALELCKRTIGEIARWHQADGLTYEFYDSEGQTPPVYLHRKARGGRRARRSEVSLGTTICDYNWTAAIFIDLVMRGACNAKRLSSDAAE